MAEAFVRTRPEREGITLVMSDDEAKTLLRYIDAYANSRPDGPVTAALRAVVENHNDWGVGEQ